MCMWRLSGVCRCEHAREWPRSGKNDRHRMASRISPWVAPGAPARFSFFVPDTVLYGDDDTAQHCQRASSQQDTGICCPNIFFNGHTGTCTPWAMLEVGHSQRWSRRHQAPWAAKSSSQSSSIMVGTLLLCQVYWQWLPDIPQNTTCHTFTSARLPRNVPEMSCRIQSRAWWYLRRSSLPASMNPGMRAG